MRTLGRYVLFATLTVTAACSSDDSSGGNAAAGTGGKAPTGGGGGGDTTGTGGSSGGAGSGRMPAGTREPLDPETTPKVTVDRFSEKPRS